MNDVQSYVIDEKIIRYFEINFRKEVRILEACGVSPRRQDSVINLFTTEPDTEDFSNTGRHCLMVALVAGILSNWDRNVMAAALLHDALKRLEVQARNLAKAGRWTDKPAPYSDACYRYFLKVLVEKDLLGSEEAERLLLSSGKTGHGSLPGLIRFNPRRRKPYLLTDDWVYLLLHAADDLVNSGKDYHSIVPIATRTKDYGKKYPFMLKQYIVPDDFGNSVITEDPNSELACIHNLVEWQIWVAGRISIFLIKKESWWVWLLYSAVLGQGKNLAVSCEEELIRRVNNQLKVFFDFIEENL